ncbi:hypothetical protein CRG98_025248 [Punica granatum]|uniref:Uncharacterized protein n=1 Tax=Punica granatum TaxID=22663 RepID=A0A2I0JDN6_PUNGR|nr:hypothetical protein CRG98_025248 [Punica granatum]
MTRSTSCGAYSRYKVVASPQYWNETRLGVGAEMATASQQAKGYVQALQLQRIRTNNLDISSCDLHGPKGYPAPPLKRTSPGSGYSAIGVSICEKVR